MYKKADTSLPVGREDCFFTLGILKNNPQTSWKDYNVNIQMHIHSNYVLFTQPVELSFLACVSGRDRRKKLRPEGSQSKS